MNTVWLFLYHLLVVLTIVPSIFPVPKAFTLGMKVLVDPTINTQIDNVDREDITGIYNLQAARTFWVLGCYKKNLTLFPSVLRSNNLLWIIIIPGCLMTYNCCYCSQDETMLIWYSGRMEKQLNLIQVSRIIPGQRTVCLYLDNFLFYDSAVHLVCRRRVFCCKHDPHELGSMLVFFFPFKNTQKLLVSFH
jgi:hypothetical protein